MHFSTATLVAFLAITNAAVIPEPAHRSLSAPALEERADYAEAAKVVLEAIHAGIEKIAGIGEFNDKRAEFAQSTTEQMWAQNPDPANLKAAICYNDAYDLKVPSGIYGLNSYEVKSGLLHSSFDCFYMSGNNAFWSRGDGGSVNLHTYYNGAACTFNSDSDLYCN